MSDLQRLIAVDVGNSRIKLGLFEDLRRDLPEPAACLHYQPPEVAAESEQALAEWFREFPDTSAVISSVDRAGSESVTELLRRCGCKQVRSLTGDMAPIEVRVDAPLRVGLDRLMAAVAANQLRRENTPAIVIDLGTAITIDLIDREGAFEGGAILPGIRTSAKALFDQTDALPDLAMSELDQAPDAVGKDTERAIRAGLFWGAVGAIREIIARQRDRLTQPPQLFLTGGAAPSVARLLASPDCTVRYFPDLVLTGIALTARSLAEHEP